MSMPAEKADMADVAAALAAAASHLPGHGQAALDGKRRQAAACFAAAGLPSIHDEDWKYTDLSRLRALLGDRLWQVAAPSPADVQAVAAAAIPALDAYRAVFVDGRLHGDLSQLPRGVSIHPLAALLVKRPQQALEVLELDEKAPLFNGFVALNAALAADGVCLCLEDGVRLDKPLYVLHFASGSGGTAHIRHAVHLGKAAEAVIIEHFTGTASDAGLTNVVTNVRLDEGASLQHYRLQEEGGRRFHIGRVDICQQGHSHVVSHAIALGAVLARTDMVVRLAGEGCGCELNGLYMAAARQHMDHHTHIDHLKPNGKSREYYKGVLDGHARAVFNGKVMVHYGAIGTDAEQANRNLLLSRHAEVDTKPELEIYADDVKCAHGATVGQLDEEQLFYLQSRGIGEALARNVLTYAFADDVIARMRLSAIRRRMEEVLLGRLPEGEYLRGLL